MIWNTRRCKLSHESRDYDLDEFEHEGEMSSLLDSVYADLENGCIFVRFPIQTRHLVLEPEAAVAFIKELQKAIGALRQ